MWGQIAGAVIGAAGSYLGAKATNKANKAISQNQMAFQERMSGTSYQRTMEDMKKAGLNPMLAYQKGGATTPGGASIPAVNALEAATSSAKGSIRVRNEMKALNAEILQKKSTTALNAQLLQNAADTNTGINIDNENSAANMILNRKLKKIHHEYLQTDVGAKGAIANIVGQQLNPMVNSASGLQQMYQKR